MKSGNLYNYKWLPALFAVLLYINTLNHSYTVDDETVITKNEIVKKGIQGIPELFSTAYWFGFNKSEDAVYRPLSLVTFAIEHQLAPENPKAGHLVNILLYALTAYFLISILTILFAGNQLPALITTLLFIAHPLHTEVVANIKSRDEILCFLFFLLSVKYLWDYLSSGSLFRLGCSAIFYFLSLLSKETALTFLAVYPLLLWFFAGISYKKIISLSPVYLAVCLIYFLVRMNVLKDFSFSGEMAVINNSLMAAPDIFSKYATAFMVIGKYLHLLIIPHPLSYDYSYAQIPVVTIGDYRAWTALLFCALLLVTGLLLAVRKNAIGFGILFFFITLSLTSNFFITIGSTMAERFLYIPSLGFCMTVGLLITIKLRTQSPVLFFKKQPFVSSILVIVLLLFSVKTISRNGDWKDNPHLYSRDVKTSPNSARTHFDYGQELLRNHAMKENDPQKKAALLEESILHLEKATVIYKEYLQAWQELLWAYGLKGDYIKAIAAALQVEKSGPAQSAFFYSDLAYLYKQSGDCENSVKMNLKALDLDIALTIAYDDLIECSSNPEIRKIVTEYFMNILRNDPSNINARQVIQHLQEK